MKSALDPVLFRGLAPWYSTGSQFVILLGYQCIKIPVNCLRCLVSAFCHGVLMDCFGRLNVRPADALHHISIRHILQKHGRCVLMLQGMQANKGNTGIIADRLELSADRLRGLVYDVFPAPVNSFEGVNNVLRTGKHTLGGCGFGSLADQLIVFIRHNRLFDRHSA